MADKVNKGKRYRLANKSSKPLLERQRRARINNSLDELKSLVLSSLYQDCPQAEQNCEKMEKAEILELTVNFLKAIRTRRNAGLRTTESDKSLPAGKFRAVDHHKCFERVGGGLAENGQTIESQMRAEQMLSNLATFSNPTRPVLMESSGCCSVYVSGSRKCENYGVAHYGIPTARPSPQLSPVPRTEVLVNPHHGQYYSVITDSQTKAIVAKTPPPFAVHVPKIQVWRPW